MSILANTLLIQLMIVTKSLSILTLELLKQKVVLGVSTVNGGYMFCREKTFSSILRQ